MKLLILTQYYPPETGAAQNRLHELAKRLKHNGVDVSVLAAMPNYPQMKVFEGYRKKCYTKDSIEDIPVFRSWIYVRGGKSIFHRLINYFSFVISSFFVGWFRTGRYDYILCESPPLFLGISAFMLTRIKRAKLIFNVSDLWPESAEKLGLIRSKFLLRMTTRLEECLYKRSALIVGQTKGIVSNISGRFPQKKVYWLPNGAELAYYDPGKYSKGWREEHGLQVDDFLVFYGGIIGHAQGLEIIIHAAERLKNQKKIKFVIMGNGPLKDKIKEMKEEKKLDNVFLFDSVPKSMMPEVLIDIDVSVVPLKKLELFKGAIPSKIFESMAMKKAVLLGVEGEARELFIEEGRGGLAFEPENDLELSEKILLLAEDVPQLKTLGQNARKYVEQKFDREKIADAFYQELISLDPNIK